MKPVVDEAWLGSLYESLAPRLVRSAGVSREDAEDLVQEAFLRLMVRPPAHDGNLVGWVRRVFANLVHDHYRKRVMQPLDEPERLVDERRFEVSEIEQEIAGWLRGLMKGLPPAYETAVAMADFERKSMREIADALGSSISGAKSRVQRGRRRLHALLVSCCHIELDARGRAIGYRRRSARCDRECASGVLSGSDLGEAALPRDPPGSQVPEQENDAHGRDQGR